MLRGGTGRCRGLVLPKLSSVSSCKCTLGKFSGEGWQIVRGLLSTDGRNILFENPTWYPSFPDTPLPSPLQTGSDSPDAGRECRMHLTHPSAPPPQARRWGPRPRGVGAGRRTSTSCGTRPSPWTTPSVSSATPAAVSSGATPGVVHQGSVVVGIVVVVVGDSLFPRQVVTPPEKLSGVLSDRSCQATAS